MEPLATKQSPYCITGCMDGDVMLTNGNEGIVLYCYDGLWGMVAESGWDNVDALVLCRQLAFSADGMDHVIVKHTYMYIQCSLVEMHPKSLHVTGMFLACNMQGFACCVHVTCRDFECFQCMLHVTCIQHYTHNTVTCMFL